MHRATTRERFEFENLLLTHAPRASVSDARRILRYGATYSRIQENNCNGHADWQGNEDLEWLARDEKKEKRIEERLASLCRSIGCGVSFQGDPRGVTIKITVPDGFTNDWGKEGLCVPTS